MPKDFKNFFTNYKDHLSIFTSRILAAVISGFFWFYLATLLTKNEYGELGFLISIATVGHALSLLGLNQVIIVYGAKKEVVLASSTSLGLLSATIVAVISYVVIQNIHISLLIMGIMVFTLLTAHYNAIKNYLNYSIQVVSQRTLSLILAIILYPIMGINGIILGVFLSHSPSFYLLKDFFINRKFGISLLKPKIPFMIHNYFVNLNWFLFWFGDKIIIGSLFGFSLLASYQLASQFLLFLNTIPIAIAVYLVPLESQGVKNKRLKFIIVLFTTILAFMAIFILPFVIEHFLPIYEEAIFTMQIMSLSIVPITIATIIESEFLGKEKSKFVLIGSSISIGTYFILIPILGTSDLGLIGLGTAFLISSSIRAIYDIFVKYKNRIFNNF